MKTRTILLPAAAVCLVAAGQAAADIVDLTTLQSGAVNGALFQRADFRPAGTGFIDSFVRVQNKGVEQGYNTSGRPVAFDEKTDPNFTRNLQVSELHTVTVGGTDYYEFRLDINEPSGNGKNLLSLDRLQIYTSAVGSQTTSNVSTLGALRYDLDAGTDSFIKLDSTFSSGSGQGDMAFLVPVSFLAGAASTDFLYLYSKFGENFASDGGFEEWTIEEGVIIPLPAASLAGSLGLFGVSLLHAKRRRMR